MLPKAHLVATAAAGLMFVVTFFHAKNVNGARFVSSSEGATTSASALVDWRMVVGVFADDTEQTAGRD